MGFSLFGYVFLSWCDNADRGIAGNADATQQADTEEATQAASAQAPTPARSVARALKHLRAPKQLGDLTHLGAHP